MTLSLDKIQLTFPGFELREDEQLEAEARHISPEEARQISEAARTAFERLYGGQSDEPHDEEKTPAWFGDYLMLREDFGWPWRVATYIAWASSPKKDRKPKTLRDLATDILGLSSPRAIHQWRGKYPAIDATVAVMQTLPLLQHKRDVIDALIKSASEPTYRNHNDRKLFLEMLGEYVPRAKMDVKRSVGVDDMSDLSDEDLDLIIGGAQALRQKVQKEKAKADESDDDDGDGSDS